jgi:hypothetical protein
MLCSTALDLKKCVLELGLKHQEYENLLFPYQVIAESFGP